MTRHIPSLLLLVGLFSGCTSKSSAESVRSHGFALEGPLDIQITHSNVAEFDGNVDIVAHIEPAGGDTRVDIHPDPTWPVSNAFLGFDKFYYNANFTTHPIIRVIDEGCDEPVVAGKACGWTVNQGSCVADGFGCFESLASADPSGNGGVDSPLSFLIAGDANILPNAQGARFSLHARYAEVPGTGSGCSGWFSDGQNLGVPKSAPGCMATQAPSCTLTMSPVLLALEPGGSGSATISVETFGTSSPVELSITSPPTPGFSFTLVPNPVMPPGTSRLLVQTSAFASAGTYSFTFGGNTGDPDVSCQASLTVQVVEEPPSGVCGCF
jgi:hypothetical protein